MAPDSQGQEHSSDAPERRPWTPLAQKDNSDNSTENTEDDDEEDDEEEDEEPQLKYVPLTKNQKQLYRNGDAVSAFLVAGDKMVRLRGWTP